MSTAKLSSWTAAKARSDTGTTGLDAADMTVPQTPERGLALQLQRPLPEDRLILLPQPQAEEPQLL